MNMRFSTSVAACIVLVAAIILPGCGDDNNVNGPQPKKSGDLDDPVLLGPKRAFDYLGECSGVMADISLSFFDSVMSWAPSATYRKFDSFSPSALLNDSVLSFEAYYDTGAGAWLFEVEKLFFHGSTDTTTQYRLDTLWLYEGTKRVKWPQETSIDSILSSLCMTQDLLHHPFQIDGRYRISVKGDILGTGTITFNTSERYSVLGLSFEGLNCSVDMDITGNASDLRMDGSIIDLGGCPESGRQKFSGPISLQCIEADSIYSGSNFWTMSATFAHDSVHWVIENATTRWFGAEVCEEDVPELFWHNTGPPLYNGHPIIVSYRYSSGILVGYQAYVRFYNIGSAGTIEVTAKSYLNDEPTDELTHQFYVIENGDYYFTVTGSISDDPYGYDAALEMTSPFAPSDYSTGVYENSNHNMLVSIELTERQQETARPGISSVMFPTAQPNWLLLKR